MRSRRDVDLLFDGIVEELNGSEMTDREPNERIQRVDEQGAPVAESQARLLGSWAIGDLVLRS